MEHAGLEINKVKSLDESETGVEDAFKARNWELAGMEKIALEAEPKDNLYVCALVAVVFVIDKPKPALWRFIR